MPNNDETRTLLRLLRKYGNPRIRFVARGRGSNRRQIVHSAGRSLNFTRDIPVSLAPTIAIYLREKPVGGEEWP